LRKNKKYIISLFCLVLITILISCNTKPESKGLEGSILFVVDELDRPIVKAQLEGAFGGIIHTPQPETQFTMYWEDGKSLAEKTLAPLIILAADLSGTGPTAELLKSMLTPQVTEGVMNGEFVIFKRDDPWARQQLLIILVGRNKRELGANTQKWLDSLFEWSYEFELQRIADMLFEKNEQQELSNELAVNYGFNIRIQHDYLVAQENDSLNYVRLIRHYPERWITIAWGAITDDELKNPDFILSRRKIIGNSFLDPVMVYDEKLSTKTSCINGKQAELINGLWATIDPTGGGPFFCYGYLDTDNKKYFLIDGAVFAPGELKVPYIWQLNAIANTFKVIH